MEELLIRPGVSPDIEILTRFDHNIKTPRVWQMYQHLGEAEINSGFKETTLPRDMKINYPQSPDSLYNRWKDLSSVLVGCIDHAPVGYITLSTLITGNMVWIKDLVVENHWRRRGIAEKLIKEAIEWAKVRSFSRISIEMSSKNYPAISLAKKLGFDYAGFNDNFFQNNDIALFFIHFIK